MPMAAGNSAVDAAPARRPASAGRPPASSPWLPPTAPRTKPTSNYGSCVDTWAPGVSITSTANGGFAIAPSGNLDGQPPRRWRRGGFTSAATVRQARPRWKWRSWRGRGARHRQQATAGRSPASTCCPSKPPHPRCNAPAPGTTAAGAFCPWRLQSAPAVQGSRHAHPSPPRPPHQPDRRRRGGRAARPVLKEVLENAMDAGSTAVEVQLEQGGVTAHPVADDGCGIPRKNCRWPSSATPPARSPASTTRARGHRYFRGEALAAIAAVSRMSITSRADGAPHAWRIDADPRELGPAALNHGTVVTWPTCISTPRPGASS